jgi:isoamylase
VGVPDVTWYVPQPAKNRRGRDAAADERLWLAFWLSGEYAKGGLATDDDLFVAINEHWEDKFFDLPALPEGKQWHVFVNTAIESPEDIHEPGQEPPLDDQKNLPVTSRSVVILVGR